MDWVPRIHEIIKDAELAQQLHHTGYVVHGNIGAANIEKLLHLYNKLHHFKAPDGGMFYSLYSDDIAYRQTVHQEIGQTLFEVYNKFFKNYKSVINSFIVKLPGPQSEFTLHQDSSGLDELKYSPLSLWIPLQDTNLDNGTLCVVPKSHGFFYPYRGISFSSPFKHFEDLLRNYLVPVNLKAGDILMFDNRLVHYSHINKSAGPRIVVMSGLFPQSADIEVCYRDETIGDSPIEVYRQTEDFLITNTAFYNNCTARPMRGEKIRELPPLVPKSIVQFLNFAQENGIEPTQINELINIGNRLNIVSEPV
jgi:Phytanoyl-CoA dioxygenase (PhyH)